MIQFFKHWWPSGIVVLVIIYATLFPDPAGVDSLPPIPYLDKLIHAIMFGGFAGALYFDWYRAHRNANKRKMLMFCFLSVAFGALIEIIQQLMGIGRSGDFFDLIADTIGAVVAFFAAPPAVAKVVRKG